MRNTAIALLDIMALDNDTVEVVQGFGLMPGELPLHPFDIHHQPSGGRQAVPGNGSR